QPAGFHYLLHLPEQADPSQLMRQADGTSHPIISYLQAIASNSQGPLLAAIADLKAAGHIYESQPLWIINAVVVRSDLAALLALSDRPDVAHVTLNADRALIPDLDLSASQPPPTLTWGLEHIGVAEVWYGLGITGTGVTVASLDSGVDWTHPALNANYRGGPGNHDGHWFDASTDSYTTPVDFIGHGTHVMGTMAGAGGIGVAPGATWITAKIVDQRGFILDSYVHLAVQWLLAPGGDPDLAPDIVNNSWGNGNATYLGFKPDMDALQAAGILAPMAAGNSGPLPETINSPASYPDSIAVGASDPFGNLAYFSSIGPSPLTAAFKPSLVAPGANVLSALPGGLYAYANGTSMATPHVSGALALLRSAAPDLSAISATQQLTATTATIGSDPLPNHLFGWGELNALKLVRAVVPHGVLNGQLTADTQLLLNGSVTVTTSSGHELHYSVTNGQFTADLQPGLYDLALNIFGYEPVQRPAILIQANQTQVVGIELTPLPTGQVSGQLLADDGVNLAGFELSVLGTGRSTRTNQQGHYSLSLPAGSYQLQLFHNGFQEETQAIAITVGASVQADFHLQPRPTILLISGNEWLYHPRVELYRQALLDNQLAFTEWQVLNPYTGAPPLEVMQQYETIIWAAPRYGPTFFNIAAKTTISNYLGSGGNLLVSGQDVADIEGFGILSSPWFLVQLGASYLADATPPFTLTGEAASTFSGLSFTLNGSDSEGNQATPDIVEIRPGRLARPLFRYADGGIAAVGSGECQPHSMVYLGFGLEGVTGRSNRSELIRRSLAQFDLPAPAAGVEIARQPIEDFVVSGDVRQYELPFYNLGEFITDTFDVTLAGTSWATQISTPTLMVGPCAVGHSNLTLTVPADLPLGITQTVTVQVRSRANPLISDSLTIALRTPTADLLLVDDDRWYDVEGNFMAALEANDVSYDVWDIGWDNNVRGSPSLNLLQAYPFVVWYTGYDWFRPVSDAELAILSQYLAGGGRLFLNSQDFLFYHHEDPFSRDYLGVLAYQESVTPTQILASRASPSWLQRPGPFPLDYGPYLNFSDGLVPRPEAPIMLWGDNGLPAGIGWRGPDWRTTFWAFPLETLPPADQAAALGDGLSWLSDLGATSFVVSEPAGDWTIGSRHRYTLTIQNNAAISNLVTMTNPLPPALALVSGTLSSGASYAAVSHTVSWQGAIEAGASFEVSYEVIVNEALPAGTPLQNEADLRYSRHELPVRRVARVWPGDADLAGSRLWLTPSTLQPPGGRYTATLALLLPAPAGLVSGSLLIPEGAHPLSETLLATSGAIELDGRQLHWRGQNLPAGPLTLTLAYTSSVGAAESWLPFSWLVQIDDGYPYLLDALLQLQPWRQWLPIIAHR
ncbi:MAG: S8 family serine peptidase, partial [Anaerolineales bacterium]|nr:S8 family serine peptidase [Anaerolineales bacterium]